MNKKLKAKIIEQFGTQSDFSSAIGQHESFISKIIRNRRQPSKEVKKYWASVLDCRIKDIFDKG